MAASPSEALVQRRATYQDVLDAPAYLVAEVIDGTLHTRARIACAVCGHTADRDVNAAANALNWARTNGAVPAPGGFNREVSARRRETRAPQCPVPPETLAPD